MAQEAGNQNLHGQRESGIEENIEETEMPQRNNSLRQRINRVLEKFASTRFGQMVLDKTERVLKVMEETAKWSLPQDDAELQLVRPLPWIPFLILLVCLRIFRNLLTICYVITGLHPLTPQEIVCMLHTKRQSVRDIRRRGITRMENREVLTTGKNNSNINSIFFMGYFGKFSSCMPDQHYQLNEASNRRPHVKDDDDDNSGDDVDDDGDDVGDDDGDDDDDDAGDNNLTVNELLEKYADLESVNDSDYIPTEESSVSFESTSDTDEIEEAENPNSSNKAQNETSKSQIDAMDTEKSNGEKDNENCESKYGSMPQLIQCDELEDDDAEENGNKVMHSRDTCDVLESGNSNKTLAATKEVAPENSMNTPTTLNNLGFPERTEITMKSTPGHESAATQKPFLPKNTTDGAQTSTSSAPHTYASSSNAAAGAPAAEAHSLTAGNQKKNTNLANHNKQYYHSSKNRNRNRH